MFPQRLYCTTCCSSSSSSCCCCCRCCRCSSYCRDRVVVTVVVVFDSSCLPHVKLSYSLSLSGVLTAVGYMMSSMVLKPLPNAAEFSRMAGFRGFTLVKTVVYDCSTNYTTGLLSLSLSVTSSPSRSSLNTNLCVRPVPQIF